MLKFNDDKTEVLIIGTRQQLAKVNINKIAVGGININLMRTRNLGVWFDNHFNHKMTINKSCKVAYYPPLQHQAHKKVLDRKSVV